LISSTVPASTSLPCTGNTEWRPSKQTFKYPLAWSEDRPLPLEPTLELARLHGQKLLVRVAKDKALPFEVKVPNAETRAAIAELEAGKGERFESVAALMADLNAGD